MISLELGGFIGWFHWNLVVSLVGLIGTWWFFWVLSLELGGFIGWSHKNLVVSLSVSLELGAFIWWSHWN